MGKREDPVELNRAATYGDESLWVRLAYLEGFRSQKITSVIRAGDRSDPVDKRHIRSGVDIPVRFIRYPGDQKRNMDASLLHDEGTTVRRTGMTVKRIWELTECDLKGTAPDSRTPELVLYHLAHHNNSVLPNEEDLVTIWHFEYCKPKIPGS